MNSIAQNKLNISVGRRNQCFGSVLFLCGSESSLFKFDADPDPGCKVNEEILSQILKIKKLGMNFFSTFLHDILN